MVGNMAGFGIKPASVTAKLFTLANEALIFY